MISMYLNCIVKIINSQEKKIKVKQNLTNSLKVFSTASLLSLMKSEIQDFLGEVLLISHITSMLIEASLSSFLEERIPLI